MCNKAHAVLYIDDNPDHLSMVQTLLETRLNALVDVATTSAGAEQLLNSRCYDLLISDVNLVGELGTTIAERLREAQPLQPVLLVTEYMHPGIIEDAAKAGLVVIDHGASVPEIGGLLRKFSQTDLPEFQRVVSTLLEGEFCHKNKQPRPCFKIQLSSPHVEAASSFLHAERRQSQSRKDS